MDVWRITVAAVRRWYILLPLLALSGFAAHVAGSGVQPEYDATGSAMVVPGQLAPTAPNPYGNVEDANTALGIVLSGPETRTQIAAQGLSTSFEVVTMTRSTISNFSIRADTPETAIATGKAIFEIAAAELQNRQEKAGVPVNERYTLDVLQEPALSAMVTEGKIRNMAIVGVVGAAGSLLTAVLFDDIIGLVRRRRTRRKKHAEVDDETSTDIRSADTVGSDAEGATSPASVTEPSLVARKGTDRVDPGDHANATPSRSGQDDDLHLERALAANDSR